MTSGLLHCKNGFHGVVTVNTLVDCHSAKPLRRERRALWDMSEKQNLKPMHLEFRVNWGACLLGVEFACPHSFYIWLGPFALALDWHAWAGVEPHG